MMPKRIFGRLSKALPHGSFGRQVGVLTGGTIFGRALVILAMPVLTRLYSPDDFSVLAVYLAILMTLSVVACLRFEIAIPLPESDETAAHLLVGSLLSATGWALLLGLLVATASDQITRLLGSPGLRAYLWLIPMGVWLIGTYGALQYWSTRHKRFGVIASTRVTQAVSGVGIMLTFGWAGFVPLGLLLGHMFTSGAGAAKLGWDALRKDNLVLKGVNWKEFRRVMHAYQRFPRYSTLEALANTAGIQVPVLIIAAAAFGPEAGFLTLAMQVMAAPMALLGGAVSQVYLSRAPEAHRNGTLSTFTAEVLGNLLRLGLGPILFAGITAPVLFPLIFGQEWARAGVLVAWMTPWIALQFLASPISIVMQVTGHQRLALLLQLAGAIFRVGATASAVVLMRGHLLEIYAATGLVFYAIYLLIVMRVAHVTLAQVWQEHRTFVNLLSIWLALALVIDILVRA